MVSAFFDACVLKFEVDILACCCLRKSPPISNGFLIMNQWHEMGARRLTRFDKSLWKSMIYMHESATISQVALKCKAHTHVYIYIHIINTLELVQHSFPKCRHRNFLFPSQQMSRKTPWETFSVSGYGPPGGEWHWASKSGLELFECDPSGFHCLTWSMHNSWHMTTLA